MQGSAIVDKEGVPIHAGDHVYTRFRGGRREGEVYFCISK